MMDCADGHVCRNEERIYNLEQRLVTANARADVAEAEVTRLRAENAALREANRWIPCSERMPKDYRLVLVAVRDADGFYVSMADHEPSCRQGCAFWRSRISGMAIAVTHWRALPEPPGCTNG